jgi:hypothetical protein
VVEWLRRGCFAPKLAIEFSQTPPDCHKTTCTITKPIDGQVAVVSAKPAFYFRFRVVNKGKTTANKCEAVLTKLFYESDNRWMPYENYTAINLVWGAFAGEYVDINPERTVGCNLLHILEPSQQDYFKGSYVNPEGIKEYPVGIILDVKGALSCQPNRLPAGKYKIIVEIYAENAKKITKEFVITWSGQWKEKLDGIFDEISIVIE